MTPKSSDRSWSLRAHVLMVANAALACRVAALLYFYLAGQAWRIGLALAVLLVAGEARAAPAELAAPPELTLGQASLALAVLAVAASALARASRAGRRWLAEGESPPRGGFTLIELLVVILIIGLVIAVALPTIVPALQHRQSSEAARLLQGALAGARDRAIHDGQPSGIRLIPDPAWPIVRLPNGQVDPSQPLACSRILPIAPAPTYTEGAVSVYPSGSYSAAVTTVNGYAGCPCLVVEEAAATSGGAPNPPTSWYWNVRVGDRIQIGNSGPWYTIVGPMTAGPAQGNSEMFVNIGPPGTTLPTLNGPAPCEFLLLVNGRDDNRNGWVDEGFDGVDNDGVAGVDEHLPGTTATVNGQVVPCDEWEVESWDGPAAAGLASVPYAIRRRPAPLPGARELALPTQVVIDLTTWGTTLERSRLPVNPWTGEVELLVQPDGTVVPTTVYSSPASFGLAAAFDHFWLAERSDVQPPSGTSAPTLPAPAGEYRLTTLSARTGRLATLDNPPIADPFTAAQQGAQ